MLLIYNLVHLILILQLNSNFVLCQRDFPNPAVIDPGPCGCDVQASACDPNCCCDPNCNDEDLKVSPICNSVRTVSSYRLNSEQSLEIWNCSNDTSAGLYDYFPFVCVQLKQNEVIGEFYPTDNITFMGSDDNAENLGTTFVNEYPELFQSIENNAATSTAYTVGAPVLLGSSSGNPLALPGILLGSTCQQDAPVLFGVDRDVTCTPVQSTLCSYVSNVTATSVWNGNDSSPRVTVNLFTGSYLSPSASTFTPNDTQQYYFLSGYSSNIDNISFTSGQIFDYCPSYHPFTRIQRYNGVCNSTPSSCPSSKPYFVTWSACPFRDSFSYKSITDNFLSTMTASTDDAINSDDFKSTSSSTSPNCSTTIRRLLLRFNYSSITNIISSADVYVLTDSSASSSARITIQWNDLGDTAAANTTVPRGYNDDEALQFRRNGNSSYVASLVPNSNGYCTDATAQTVRYKRSTSSSCYIQLSQSTLGQCHALKLNMYIYFNVFYAPATDVLTYPGSTATVSIRDDTQDSKDLDIIDVTRSSNRLTQNYISNTELKYPAYKIYDATTYLKTCFNVPSGVYVEFGYVRVPISSTVSYERIVSVQYTYMYSNWSFDCTGNSCDDTATQKYLVTFQSSFVDYTNTLFNRTDTTRSDLTSSDNSIQHLLWLITPEYKGEPGYRNYTIAMILIFIAISGVVLHILLFGFMCPF